MTHRGTPGGPGEPGETRRRKSLGRLGEAVARKYLESEGFHILKANYRLRGGEIDIVAKKGRTLVFCEVKTRVREGGEAVEGYGSVQQGRMVRMSEAYLAENADLLPKVFDVRYDLIVIGEGAGGVLEVKEHMADAFRPT